MKRRDFIQTASFAAVGMLSIPVLSSCRQEKNIGLQLYTLRDIIGKDNKDDLKKVASFGYKELKTYGYAEGKIFDMDFTEFNEFVKGLGMSVVSGHYGLDKIKGDTWQKAVEDAKKNGQKYMVVPYIDESE